SEDLASNIDLTDAINRFLRSLPIEQRRVFIKRYWYMSSITDTATSFGMSESKVTSILFRVRNKLKDHLTKEGFDLLKRKTYLMHLITLISIWSKMYIRAQK
ncbi:MAG: hypothetical protein J6B55_02065, partial [Clostridia bacterium]|nr:hypothetical protein [Clostridia bacterium]